MFVFSQRASFDMPTTDILIYAELTEKIDMHVVKSLTDPELMWLWYVYKWGLLQIPHNLRCAFCVFRLGNRSIFSIVLWSKYFEQ